MNLKIIGNSTKDLVFREGVEGRTILLRAESNGGINNLTPRLTVPYMVYTGGVTTYASIVQSENYKAVTVDWAVPDFRETDFVYTDYAHISYLNCVNIDLSKNIRSKIISADLAHPRPTTGLNIAILIKQLSFIDYLIISEDDSMYLPLGVEVIVHLVKKAVILRNREFVHILEPTRTRELPNRQISVPDTVGAGDAFVAEFLNNLVTQGFNQTNEAAVIEKCVEGSIDYLRGINGL